jgi:hypothetical protein
MTVQTLFTVWFRANLAYPNGADLWVQLHQTLSGLTKWSDVVVQWKVCVCLSLRIASLGLPFFTWLFALILTLVTPLPHDCPCALPPLASHFLPGCLL